MSGAASSYLTFFFIAIFTILWHYSLIIHPPSSHTLLSIQRIYYPVLQYVGLLISKRRVIIVLGPCLFCTYRTRILRIVHHLAMSRRAMPSPYHARWRKQPAACLLSQTEPDAISTLETEIFLTADVPMNA